MGIILQSHGAIPALNSHYNSGQVFLNEPLLCHSKLQPSAQTSLLLILCGVELMHLEHTKAPQFRISCHNARSVFQVMSYESFLHKAAPEPHTGNYTNVSFNSVTQAPLEVVTFIFAVFTP